MNQDDQLCDVALDYSLSINDTDTLIVQYEDSFSGIGKMLVEKATERGAKTISFPYNLTSLRAMIERANEKELESYAQRAISMADCATGRVRMSVESNPFYLQGIAPEKISLYSGFMRPFVDRICGGNGFPAKKWLVLGYPCEAEAKNAGLSYAQWSDFVYSACLRDWTALKRQMTMLKSVFDDASDIHILVPNSTDLHLSLKGRGAEVCAGKFNLPDGEFFYGPVEDSLEGHITFEHSTSYDGNSVRHISFQFKEGNVVEHSAKEGLEFLTSYLERDGCRRAGEFGVGCNDGIAKPTGKILYDEKMGGTIHLAMGESYEGIPLSAGGGLNKAKGHWDMICDLRPTQLHPGGQILVDGVVVQENGVWKV